MWFHNKHISLYWIANELNDWIMRVRTQNKPDIFPEELI